MRFMLLATVALVSASCSRGQGVDVTNVGSTAAHIELAFGGQKVSGDVDGNATRHFQLWQGDSPASMEVTAKWQGQLSHSMVFRSAYPKGNTWRMNVSPTSGVVLGSGAQSPGIPAISGVAIAAVLLAWAWRVFRIKPKAPNAGS